MFGFNEKEQNNTLLPSILSHMTSGASTKQVLHYLQEINSGKWLMSEILLKFCK